MTKDVAITLFGKWVNENFPGCGVCCLKSEEINEGWKFICLSPLGIFIVYKNDGKVYQWREDL